MTPEEKAYKILGILAEIEKEKNMRNTKTHYFVVKSVTLDGNDVKVTLRRCEQNGTIIRPAYDTCDITMSKDDAYDNFHVGQVKAFEIKSTDIAVV